MNNIKSQGLSLNTIIISAIVLIVLIVIWAIFTGRIGGFSKEVKECRDYELYDECPPGYVNYPGAGSKAYCCVELESIEGAEIEKPESM